MGNKNHRRYKLRKMNSVKKPITPLFEDSPKLIRNWDELRGMENQDYEIKVGDCNASIISKKDGSYYNYLSTHTFYGSQYYSSTLFLRSLGFNVQLENWDGKTQFADR